MLLVSDSMSAASRSISGEVTGAAHAENAQHIADSVDRFGVDFRPWHSEGFVDGLDDDLVGGNQVGNEGGPCDKRGRLFSLLGKLSHPLVIHKIGLDIAKTEFVEIVVGSTRSKLLAVATS